MSTSLVFLNHSFYVCLIDQKVSGLGKGHCSIQIGFRVCKAFDMVDHRILLQKLNRFGVRVVPAPWIHSYISEKNGNVLKFLS